MSIFGQFALILVGWIVLGRIIKNVYGIVILVKCEILAQIIDDKDGAIASRLKAAEDRVLSCALDSREGRPVPLIQSLIAWPYEFYSYTMELGREYKRIRKENEDKIQKWKEAS